MNLHQAKETLRNTFGYPEFRPLQQEAISQVLGGTDTLLIMPTGGGKSLCYQIPAILFDGLAVVVSPLISLMNDQVMQLGDLGVESIVINSSLDRETYHKHQMLVRNNEVDLVYMAPETLLKPDMVRLLKSANLDLLAIDEAHCISEWGHDFRPEYRRLAELRQEIPDASCIALTATATEQVREDIRKQLNIGETATLLSSFDRQNLFLEVRKKQNGLQQLLEFLDGRKQESGIIYCFSRKQVDELTADLQEHGYDAEGYHAGRSDADRHRIQEDFVRDDTAIIVATIAFGMGINKPNVRYVVHYELPKNIESYYQQIGRAGRDGLDSDCLLLYAYGDVSKQRFFIDQKEGQVRDRELDLLYRLVDYVESRRCRRVGLLDYFGETYDPPCGMCDNCQRADAEKVDVTVQAQKLLSCAVKTDQVYGIAHLVRVLRGSRAKKVLEAGHEKLSTYDIGSEWNRKQWRLLYRQMLGEDILIKDRKHGSVKLTQKALPILKGEQKVHLPKEELAALERSSSTRTTRRKAMSSVQDQKFEHLRKLRKRLADEQNVPPYVIFSDKTLLDLVKKEPTNRNELMDVHGVGKVKARKYGKTFLEAMYAFEPIKKRPSGTRHVVAMKYYNQGQSIDDIADQMGIKPSTVTGYLQKAVMDSMALAEPERLLKDFELTASDAEAIRAEFAKAEDHRLKPIFDHFEERYSYDQLKAVRTIMLNEEQQS
jgi:ATP-dependent DNA helicase RecQ